jgi:hypothetical protein
MRRLLLAGVMGAALAAPIITSAMAQTVPTDPQGFSPYNTHGTLDENINTPVVRNAPALGLSSIYGLNPCSLGASVGVTTPLFGIGGAISTTDKDCETRNTAALAITGLKDEEAGREIMCVIKEFREAVARLGKPCIADQSSRPVAVNTPPAPAIAQQAPTQQPSLAVTKPGEIAPNAPAFCQTPGLVLSSYPECTQSHATQTESSGAKPIAGRDHYIVRASAKKPEVTAVEKKSEEPAAERQTPQNTFKLDPVAARPTNVVALLSQRRATMLAAGDTSAVRLIDERLASLETTPIEHAATTRPAQQRPAQSQEPPGMMATLMERGAAMAAAGDIVAARLFYERAAAAGSGQAAIEIGKTYDPQYLAQIHSVGIRANPMLAASWYQRAIAMGDTDAASLLRVASR